MNITELTNHLKQIDSVKITVFKGTTKLLVENALQGYSITIECEKIEDVEFIMSPMGEECAQIFYSDGRGIIVTPNDFVFEVEQDEFIQVDNLPPMCSVREMILGFDNYKLNPCPSPNMDNNIGLFYLHYYIFKSAKTIGFEVPMINELYAIGEKNGFLINEVSALFENLPNPLLASTGEINMNFEKKYLFNNWNDWNHTIFESAEDFQEVYGYSPNILLANNYTFSQIDFIANINPDIGKDVSREDDVTGVKEFALEIGEDFGISSFQSDHHDIAFCLDHDLLDKEFILIYDDEPEDDDSEGDDVPIDELTKINVLT